jgi:hypothetical protein
MKTITQNLLITSALLLGMLLASPVVANPSGLDWLSAQSGTNTEGHDNFTASGSVSSSMSCEQQIAALCKKLHNLPAPIYKGDYIQYRKNGELSNVQHSIFIVLLKAVHDSSLSPSDKSALMGAPTGKMTAYGSPVYPSGTLNYYLKDNQIKNYEFYVDDPRIDDMRFANVIISDSDLGNLIVKVLASTKDADPVLSTKSGSDAINYLLTLT